MTALLVGSRGIDYSKARPPITEIKEAGAKFVIRYSAGSASNPAHASYPLNEKKLITPQEFRDLVAAGLDIFANDEWYESRVTEGPTAGLADGHTAGALWKSCGLARGASIYVSWDADPVPASWSKVDAYLRAYDVALGGYYHVDCYAGDAYRDHAKALGIIKYGWRPNANSWSGNDGLPYQPSQAWIDSNMRTILNTTSATIWQTGNYWFNKGADENVLLRAGGGSHLQALGTPVPPVPAKPVPHVTPPVLHAPWPTYMRIGDYFGDINGPKASHGGYYPNERAAVKAIQQRLQGTGYAPKVAGWADGLYESATTAAVTAWKRHVYGKSVTRPGEIWKGDWVRLFTY